MIQFISLITSLFLVSNLIGTSQVSYSSNTVKSLKVVLEKNSNLVINGKTNVNKFQCAYEGALPYDTMAVEVNGADNKFFIDNAQASVQVKRFDCGAGGITNDFRDLLKADQHPLLKINILSFTMKPSDESDHQWDQGKAEVEFTIAGESVVYPVNFDILDQDHDQFYVGTLTIDITDFSLQPPSKFLGLLVVNKEVEIDFKINLQVI